MRPAMENPGGLLAVEVESQGMNGRPVLPLARYRFSFDAATRVALPGFSGSAWRGAFGHALKRAVCITRLPVCAECLLYRSCAYPYVFETPPPLGAAKMRKYPAAPHPFILEVEAAPGRGLLEAGAALRVGVSLFGRGNRHLPYVVFALERAAAAGIGRGRGKLALVAVEQESRPGGGEWTAIYAPGGGLEPLPEQAPDPVPVPGDAVIRLHAPLRLKRDERLVGSGQFDFAALFSSLLRRISMLTYFHTDTPLDTNFAGLAAAARAVPIADADLSWQDWTRYSSRQNTAMEMGGLVGSFRVGPCDLKPFWPYLWLGQFTHAGHGTSMGLGRYTLEPASLQAQPLSPQ
jgi:hypothetical protein